MQLDYAEPKCGSQGSHTTSKWMHWKSVEEPEVSQAWPICFQFLKHLPYTCTFIYWHLSRRVFVLCFSCILPSLMMSWENNTYVQCKSYSGVMLYCCLIFKHLLIFGDQNEHSMLIKKKTTTKLHICIALYQSKETIPVKNPVHCEVLTLMLRALNLSSQFSPRYESLTVEVGNLFMKVLDEKTQAWKEDTSGLGSNFDSGRGSREEMVHVCGFIDPSGAC